MAEVPDHTAVRVALWRALHVQLDAAPHVLEDEIGLRLVAPEEGWRSRPDMHPMRTRFSRASITARARFVEDLVEEREKAGVSQYVILGAGLDTFVQRRSDLAPSLDVFEVEQPATQAWKRERLVSLGYGVPAHLHLVPVDFEAKQSWREAITHAGFDLTRPAVVSSLGVAMYLTRETVGSMLSDVASLAPGSTFAMSFMKPLDLIEPDERPGIEAAARGARERGTPFLSVFAPDEIVALAKERGFRDVRYVPAAELTTRYFADRSDGLRPSTGEELIVATA